MTIIIRPARPKFEMNFSSANRNTSNTPDPVDLTTSAGWSPTIAAKATINSPEISRTPCGLYFLYSSTAVRAMTATQTRK